jgi:FkbM family methyltransferase
MDDFLIWCRRKLAPLARRIGAQHVARRLYDELAVRRYPSGSLCTAVQNGRTWRLRREVAERGAVQEIDTIEWLRGVVKPGMTVLDIGANVGQMTLESALLVGPKGRVVAVEPSIGNLEYLRQHVDGNALGEWVQVVPAACAGEHGGEIEFFVATEDGNDAGVGSGHNIVGAAAIFKQNRDIQVREVRVPRVSIDGLCGQMGLVPAVIKIDVEGAELQVLRGGIGTLRSARPQVRVGFHPFAFDDPASASAELLDLAQAAGYWVEGAARGQTLELAEYNLLPQTSP